MGTALKFRHELKYTLNLHQYTVIRQRLKALLKPDQHAGSNGDYHIRSLYFDDINNKALHEKLGGVRDREKYRIRIYNGSDRVIHLEKKIKFNDYITKVKEPLSRDDVEQIVSGQYEVLNVPDKPLRYEMYLQMKNNGLRPKVIVDYVREAYVYSVGNVRITFDKDLRTGLNRTDLFHSELPTVKVFDTDLIVLEVKYDEFLPEHIRIALQHEGLIRQSNSKYVICRKLLKNNTWEDQ